VTTDTKNFHLLSIYKAGPADFYSPNWRCDRETERFNKIQWGYCQYRSLLDCGWTDSGGRD